MISCQDADVLAAALSVGSLDAADEAGLHAHLNACADCRRLAGEYMEAAARLPIALEPLQPPRALRTRLMKAVYAEAAAAQAHRATSTAEPGRATDTSATATAGRAASLWRRLWGRVPQGRGFTLAAAGAAAALIGVAAWGAGGRTGTPAPARSVALTAMSGAPAARGQLVLDRAAGDAVLTVTGLPTPAVTASGEAAYEVWLIPAHGAPVAAAFLSRSPDGTWTAAMRGEMSAYATVAATVEPPGGSPSPTGAEVFQATLSSS